MPPGLERERGKRKKGAVSDSEVPSFGLQGGQFPLKAGAVLASSLLPVLWYYKINGKGYVFLAPLWAASFPAPGGLGPGVTGQLSFPGPGGLRPCCRREVFFSGASGAGPAPPDGNFICRPGKGQGTQFRIAFPLPFYKSGYRSRKNQENPHYSGLSFGKRNPFP